MVDERDRWLFDGIPRRSKLGTLLDISTRRVLRNSPPDDELELRVKVVEDMSEAAGCEIKPYDFVALGPQYLATAPGKREAEKLGRYFDQLETIARRQSRGRSQERTSRR
jgi:hypothetical protein